MATMYFRRADGIDVWAFDVVSIHGAIRRVITLSDDVLSVAPFAPKQNLDSVTAALRDGRTPADVLGRVAITISLSKMRSVESIKTQRTAIVEYSEDGKRKTIEILTPRSDFYADVFTAIHNRLGGHLPIRTKVASIKRTLTISPFTGVGVLALVILAVSAVFPDGIHQHPVGHGKVAVVGLLLQQLGALLGRHLGYLVGAAIIPGIIVAIIYRLKNRPRTQRFEPR